MITLDDDIPDAPPHDMPGRFAPLALLSACAQEAGHLAAALATLDTTLGQAIDATGAGLGFDDGGTGSALLLRGLQNADRARQEGEGLAKLLLLLSRAVDPVADIPDDAIRTCLPLVAQQRRIMTAAAQHAPATATARSTSGPEPDNATARR